MSDEVILEGETYISSRRAAEMCGYAQDYVGQLARSSRIEARRVAGLWYVRKQSLIDHQARSENYVPAPDFDTDHKSADTIESENGSELVSANRASKLSGYNQDYIGQLARSGQIPGKQIGNRWYVDIEALRSHKKTKDTLLAAVQTASVGLVKADSAAQAGEPVETTTHFSYTPIEAPLLPLVEPDPIDSEAPVEFLAPEQEVNKVPIRVYRGSMTRRLPPVRDMISKKLAMSVAAIAVIAVVSGTALLIGTPARITAGGIFTGLSDISDAFRGGSGSTAAAGSSSFSLSGLFGTHLSYTRDQ